MQALLCAYVRCRVAIRARLGFRDSGVGLVEYALLLGLIALVCIAAVTYLGSSTCSRLSAIPEEAFSAQSNATC